METRVRRRSQQDYTMTFKISVVTQVEKGVMTYRQAQKQYGIQGKCTVLKWLRKLGTLDWNNRKINPVSKSKERTPEQRIRELEAALEEERNRNLLLNTIIDVAEKQYGLSIRKKSSPKQQSNSSKQDN